MPLTDHISRLPDNLELPPGASLPETAEHSSTRPKRFLTAAAISLVFHFLLILALAPLLTTQKLSTEAPSVTEILVSFEVPGTAQENASESVEAQPQTQDIDAPPEAASPENNTPPATFIAAEPPMVPAAQPAVAPPPPAVATELDVQPATPSQQMVVSIHNPEVSTSIAQIASPTIAPVSVPIKVEHREMLKEQIDQWSEDIYEILELEGLEDQFAWQHQGVDFQASFEKIEPVDDTDFERIAVTVIAELDGQKQATKIYLRRLAFSDYGQFIDRWERDTVLFNDVIDGRLHSNTRIMVDANAKIKPLIYGKVTTASTTELTGRARRSSVFLGGLETRVKRIELPEDVAPLKAYADSSVADDQVHVIEGDAEIVFYSSGEYSWTTENQPEQRRQINGDAYYILGSEDSILSVRGVVKGRVVVYSPDTISIAGSLRYYQDPLAYADSSDFLGLISDRYIEIASPKVTGPGDISVYAALYAKRRFSVRRFRARNYGLLTIYGSLAAGTVSATEPRYATKISFDQRFMELRPPGFPLTERYELEAWDQQWTAVN